MSFRRSLRVTGFVCATALAAVACGGGSDTAAPAATEAPDAAVESTPEPTSGGAVPEIMAFTSPLVGGGQLDAATLVDKPTAFWFWSPT